MLILIGRIRFAAEKREAVLSYLKPFLAASRAETACLRFTVSEDIEQPNYFLFTEIWQDEAALTAHESSEHLATFKQQIGSWIVEREKTQVYHIRETRDM